MSTLRDKIKQGQRVRLTIEGTILSPENKEGWIIIDTNDYVHQIWPADELIEVAVLEEPKPRGWPPLQGDVWETNGQAFLVRTKDGLNETWFIGSDLMSEYYGPPGNFLKSHPSVSLVYRQGS